MKKPELLAPAGDLRRAKTAIRYGADAVYIGGQSFSLRSRASNFTLDDIKEACAFAREYGARIHVTVNIIPHDEDLEGLKEYLVKLESFGVAAIISASPYIMKTAKEVAPGLEVHASTQMSVTNAEAVKFLKNTIGVDRVVLARECTMEEVKKIAEDAVVDTEAFIHGGMCVNYSGRCTLSNRMTLRDANRGGCAQSCRWMYEVYENDEKVSEMKFTLGSRDLCASEYIYDLMEAGVSSFKIEGRMKTEYYVASIVSSYRHLIDEIYSKQRRLTDEEMQVFLKELKAAENRETCSGFYSGKADLESLIYHPNNNATVNHDFLGTVKEVYSDGTCLVETRNPFAVGEEMEFLCAGKENRRYVLKSMVLTKTDEKISEIRNPMSLVVIDAPFDVQVDDILRRAR